MVSQNKKRGGVLVRERGAATHYKTKSTKSSDHGETTAVEAWRILFYLVMSYEWACIHHGPTSLWETAFAMEHSEWAVNIVPVFEETAFALKWFGVLISLLSLQYDWATVVFAGLYVHYISTVITNFTNHDYLFCLLSCLMAFYSNARDPATKAAWIEALRGQIVVVYAFASLWKMHPQWVDGTICQGIFLSFEEQGVNRGVPWHAIKDYFPQVFVGVAVGGLCLDFCLFIALAFLPPGHWLQSAALLFHGFTAFTMSQRIGYTFPIAMICSGTLCTVSRIVHAVCLQCA